MDSKPGNLTASTPFPNPAAGRGKFRRFDVGSLDEGGTIYSAFGMTLDRVVECETVHYRHRFDLAMGFGQAPDAFVGEEFDLVVWEGFRVAGVLHPRPDGSLHFARVGVGPGGPAR